MTSNASMFCGSSLVRSIAQSLWSVENIDPKLIKYFKMVSLRSNIKIFLEDGTILITKSGININKKPWVYLFYKNVKRMIFHYGYIRLDKLLYINISTMMIYNWVFEKKLLFFSCILKLYY